MIRSLSFFLKVFYFLLSSDLATLLLHNYVCRPSIRVPPKIVNFILPVVRWMRHNLESETEISDRLASVQFIIESSLYTRTFNCSAATEHIKYSPVVSMEVSLPMYPTHPMFGYCFILLLSGPLLQLCLATDCWLLAGSLGLSVQAVVLAICVRCLSLWLTLDFSR